ncbi:curli-like amyloid fiber formation chaperone CsgH [Sinorhizobium numidicum]|uniref:Curli-like amyloid fiber formation chaperone CsgH n=1 Tax=Sinorhizobium numidicum TaxID=680248 RepID=A0ABY8CTD7_9HYPH|nr:curli-like amyloid fiber formation chaperone CsgH [Sinorhizobium numidicum]WEX74741.1 curli-like amyloid fiber formation chaperone CsgH [Sinorhizobium numidicum]WEX80732.1 curli-like amyloid fiber formation chaperone CsgH [Sinorhizobium numidicum]
MHRIVNHPRRVMTALALVLAPAATLAAMGAADQATGPVRCEIRAAPQGSSMLALEALVHADGSVSGSYSFHVESVGTAGGTNIEQAGAFDASPSRPAVLGAVALSAKGAYDATLEVTVGGEHVRCTERVGGGRI